MSWTARTMFELMAYRDGLHCGLLAQEAVLKFAQSLIAGTY